MKAKLGVSAAIVLLATATPALAQHGFCIGEDTRQQRVLVTPAFPLTQAEVSRATAAFFEWIKSHHRADFLVHNVTCSAYSTTQQRDERRAYFANNGSGTAPGLPVNWTYRR
jgi:hypothetical protein